MCIYTNNIGKYANTERRYVIYMEFSDYNYGEFSYRSRLFFLFNNYQPWERQKIALHAVIMFTL